MNTYNAYYKGRQIEVKATTSFNAQELAAKEFKAKKRYDVTVILVATQDQSVTHDPATLG